LGAPSGSSLFTYNYNTDVLSVETEAIQNSTIQNLYVPTTFNLGADHNAQIFYPQPGGGNGSAGFSVNENFNAAGTEGNQTAYHFTSGDPLKSIVFDIAVTDEYTTMFGTLGNSAANSFVIGSETTNTNFYFKNSLGIAPVNLAGGITLLQLTSNGSVIIPNGNAPESLTDPGEVGQIGWSNDAWYLCVYPNEWKQLQFDNPNFPETQVLVGGSNGSVTGSAGLTFNSTTETLSTTNATVSNGFIYGASSTTRKFYSYATALAGDDTNAIQARLTFSPGTTTTDITMILSTGANMSVYKANILGGVYGGISTSPNPLLISTSNVSNNPLSPAYSWSGAIDSISSTVLNISSAQVISSSSPLYFNFTADCIMGSVVSLELFRTGSGTFVNGISFGY
jgi:hypothetical protein